MKEFIKKSFFFVTILVAILLFIENNLSAIPNSYSIKRKCLVAKASTLEVLVLGSSEAFYDIDSTILGNSCNIANSNQDLYFDYQLVKKYVPALKNLKIAIIPISYFSLEYNLENTEEYWRKFFYYRYFGIKSESNKGIDIRNYSLIALYTPENARDYIIHGYKKDLAENVSPEGWFSASIVNNLEGQDAIDNAIRHTSYMNEELFDTNTKLLEDIINELRLNNVRVILTTLPVSRKYFNNIDRKRYERMSSKVGEISRNYKLTYLNYVQDSRFTEEDFIDNSDHLNSDAATFFSKILLADIIKQ